MTHRHFAWLWESTEFADSCILFTADAEPQAKSRRLNVAGGRDSLRLGVCIIRASKRLRFSSIQLTQMMGSMTGLASSQLRPGSLGQAGSAQHAAGVHAGPAMPQCCNTNNEPFLPGEHTSVMLKVMHNMAQCTASCWAHPEGHELPGKNLACPQRPMPMVS